MTTTSAKTATAGTVPAGSPAIPASAWWLAALPPLFFSGNFLFARAMRDAIPPFQMSFWRWAVALVILLPFCLPAIRAQWPRIRTNLPFLALLGAVGVTAFNCFVYAALHHTTVVNAALVNSLLPIATFLLAFLILKQKLAPRQILGIAVSLAGAAVVIARGDVTALRSFSPNPGDLLVLAGMSFWALYTVLIRWRPLGLEPMALLGVTVAFGVLFHLPLVAWEYRSLGGFTLDAASAGTILYLAIFPSILAYIFWNRSVAVLGPGRTGMFMHLLPIFSAILATLFLGERLALYHALGFALVVVGIVIVTRPPAAKPA
ncbi:DMT family transporter [Bosea sp. WAO]|uniref:DMT family transporter n=1 Tax=Bosea sp. WAO TaxID=406341 RepID=UPI00083055DF|nr:DMT family transporter [Bosea sp. WAO]